MAEFFEQISNMKGYNRQDTNIQYQFSICDADKFKHAYSRCRPFSPKLNVHLFQNEHGTTHCGNGNKKWKPWGSNWCRGTIDDNPARWWNKVFTNVVDETMDMLGLPLLDLASIDVEIFFHVFSEIQRGFQRNVAHDDNDYMYWRMILLDAFGLGPNATFDHRRHLCCRFDPS